MRAFASRDVGDADVVAVVTHRAFRHFHRQDRGFAEELRHERGFRPRVQLFRRADLRDPAVIDHSDAIGQGQRLALVMRDIDRREAKFAVQTPQLDLHGLTQRFVERRQGFIHQEHARAEYNGARHRDALSLTSRKAFDRPISEPFELHECKSPRDLGGDLGARCAPQPQRIGDIVADRHMGKQRIGLKHHAHIAPVRRKHSDIGRANSDVAGVRHGEAGNRHQERCLTRSGRTEQGQEFARAHIQADAVQDPSRAKADNQARDLDRHADRSHSAGFPFILARTQEKPARALLLQEVLEPLRHGFLMLQPPGRIGDRLHFLVFWRRGQQFRVLRRN